MLNIPYTIHGAQVPIEIANKPWGSLGPGQGAAQDATVPQEAAKPGSHM